MPLATTFSVPGMDCPTEERLVRMAVEPHDAVSSVSVDLSKRVVVITHEGPAEPLVPLMEKLGFGAVLEGSAPAEESLESTTNERGERSVLVQLLVINAIMFAGELIAGVLGQSTALLADSLDMLGDALVYSVALYAVGRGAHLQARAAQLSGIIQLTLAFGIFSEVVRRIFFGAEPQSLVIIAAALVALGANLLCIWLLRSHREGGVHMKASWIFSTNDALANVGVILGGVLVYFTESMIPDLVIGTVITALVTRSAIRILRLAKTPAG